MSSGKLILQRNHALLMEDLIGFYESDYMWIFQTEDYDEMSFMEWFFLRLKLMKEKWI